MEPKILHDLQKLKNREKKFLDFFKTIDGDDSDAFLSKWFSESLKNISNPSERSQKLDDLKNELMDKLRGSKYEEEVNNL